MLRRRPFFYGAICRIIGVPPASAVFTYGNTVYSPSTLTLSWDLRVHEATHRDQQGATPWLWWIRYLLSRRFRIEQETEAYRAQLKTFPRSQRGLKARDFAAMLASPMYGSAIKHSKAYEKVTEAV